MSNRKRWNGLPFREQSLWEREEKFLITRSDMITPLSSPETPTSSLHPQRTPAFPASPPERQAERSSNICQKTCHNYGWHAATWGRFPDKPSSPQVRGLWGSLKLAFRLLWYRQGTDLEGPEWVQPLPFLPRKQKLLGGLQVCTTVYRSRATSFSKGVNLRRPHFRQMTFQNMTSEPERPSKWPGYQVSRVNSRSTKCPALKSCSERWKPWACTIPSESPNIYSVNFIITRNFPKEMSHSCADTSKEE